MSELSLYDVTVILNLLRKYMTLEEIFRNLLVYPLPILACTPTTLTVPASQCKSSYFNLHLSQYLSYLKLCFFSVYSCILLIAYIWYYYFVVGYLFCSKLRYSGFATR